MSESSPSELKERVSLLELAMSSTSCGVTIADASQPDMPLIYINEAFERITGYPSKDVIGKNCRFLQGDTRDPEPAEKIRNALDHQEHITIRLKNYRKDGSLFWNELNLSPIFDKDGMLTHFVGIQTDVTAEVEGKIKLHSSREALKDAVQDLEETNREKDKLLGVVAHDLRGPIGTIRSLVELSENAEDYERKEFLDLVLETADRSLSLINDLLSHTAIHTGRIELKKEEVDVEDFLDQFSKSARIRARQKDIEFQLRKEIQLKTIWIDPKRFGQVLENLFSNALKFSNSNTAVQLVVTSDQEEALFQVIDQGQGIPEEEFKHLFQPFKKTSVTPTGGEASSGLGLSIAKRLVELHGGEISVESEPQKGATFSVRIPVRSMRA